MSTPSMKIKALYKYVYTFVDEKGFRYPYRYSWHLLSCCFFVCFFVIMKNYDLSNAECRMFFEVSTPLIRKLCGLRTRRGCHICYAPPTLKLGSMLV